MASNSDPILIIDDEKDNLEALQRLLRSQYDVAIANSPFEALKLIQKKQFHVVVSDQRMPEMTGVELLEKIKKLSPTTTRILLTGYTDIESVIDAINRGNIYRYVAKPWDPEDLKLTLRQANDAFLIRNELEQKNSALFKANQELEKALGELEVLDRAKARFLSLISHELNTPLTVLNSFVELLLEKKTDVSADVQKAISSISGASERFSEIVGEVLTYVRLVSNPNLDLKALDFVKELDALKQELEPVFNKKQVRIESSNQGNCVVECDPEKMRVALRQLLLDALVRAPEKSKVQAVLKQENGKVTLVLLRSGDPISDAAFLPLEAAGKEMHHQKNLGLSLAICKLVIDAHKAQMEIEGGTGIKLSFMQ